MKPELCAVLGNPIAHSKSPDIHQQFAKQFGMNLQFDKVQAPLDDFAGTVAQLVTNDYVGCSVTLPFKLEAFELAHQRSPQTELARAANCLHLRNNQIVAHNTDGIGLGKDLTRLGLHRASNILLLGAGGAAAGVLAALIELRPKRLQVLNRSADKAEKLIAQHQAFAAQHHVILSAGVEQADFDLVINATSASIQGQTVDLPNALWQQHPFCYDLMYSAQDTVFIQAAKAQQCPSSDGLGMLVEQAAESFYLWFGLRPCTLPVLEWMRNKTS